VIDGFPNAGSKRPDVLSRKAIEAGISEMLAARERKTEARIGCGELANPNISA
jgi:hypothetical protein